MNREDIVRMAREAGFDVESDEFFNYKPQHVFSGIEADIQRFAFLIAAAEREECAKAVENYAGAWDDEGYAIAQAIRARGSELVPSNIMSSHKKVL